MSETRDILATLFPLSNLNVEELAVLDEISAESASLLVRSLFRECKNSPDAVTALPQLVAFVSQSDVAISQWVNDVIAVYSWLQKRGSAARVGDVLEYVSCSREGSALQPGHSIEWYLDTYGFEKLRR